MTDTFTSLCPLSFEGSIVPEHTRQAISDYYYHRLPPGGFLTAVLSNDLSGAVMRADHWNKHRLVDIVVWMHSNMPTVCWGSPEAVKDWLAQKASP